MWILWVIFGTITLWILYTIWNVKRACKGK